MFILKEVKVLYFDTLLQVFIPGDLDVLYGYRIVTLNYFRLTRRDSSGKKGQPGTAVRRGSAI